MKITLDPCTFVADSVTLNCTGHQVSAPGEIQAILIQHGRDSILLELQDYWRCLRHVRNWLHRHCDQRHYVAFGNEGTGMFLTSSDGLTIQNNLSTNNRDRRNRTLNS
jgi:hypothetical protein